MPRVKLFPFKLHKCPLGQTLGPHLGVSVPCLSPTEYSTLFPYSLFKQAKTQDLAKSVNLHILGWLWCHDRLKLQCQPPILELWIESSGFSACDPDSVHTSWEAADDGTSTWAPATHAGDLGGIPGPWLQPGSALACCSHLGS